MELVFALTLLVIAGLVVFVLRQQITYLAWHERQDGTYDHDMNNL